MNNTEMKNPRSRDTSQYIDVDIRFITEDEDGNLIYGEWMPHTILSDDERFTDIANGSLGTIVQEAPIRDVPAKFQEAMSQGVEWIGGNTIPHRLIVDNANERDRILSAATRLSINNTLPKNKSEFNYPDVNGNMVMVPKADVQDVAMLIQDYVEECHDNYNRLLSDTTLDINSGWPA